MAHELGTSKQPKGPSASRPLGSATAQPGTKPQRAARPLSGAPTQGASGRAGVGFPTFDNARAFERVRQAYSCQNVWLGVLVPALITGVSSLLHVSGFAPSYNRGPVYLLPWLLVVLHTPAIAWAAWAVRARWPRSFAAAYATQSLVQVLWLQFLCWYSTPFFTAVGCIVLVSWVFNDAWVFYGARISIWPYVLAFPLFDGALVALDAAGLDGLFSLGARAPELFSAFLAVQGLGAFLIAFVLRHVGSACQERDEQTLQMEALSRQLALVKRERDVLEMTSGLLSRGLLASKFSHDVSAPLTVQQVLVHDLTSVVEELLSEADDNDDREEEVRAMLRELTRSIESATQMCAELSEGLREEDILRPVPVGTLLEEAAVIATKSVTAYGVTAVRPHMHLQPHNVWVSRGIATTLGNLLANGIVQRPELPLVITGHPVSPSFYRLSIRDFGVTGESRQRALRRIAARVALERDQRAAGEDLPRPAYPGQGVALTLAKVLLVRCNGWLDYVVPEGPGLDCRVVLPTRSPEEIDETENIPSAHARTSNEQARLDDEKRSDCRTEGMATQTP